MWFPLHAESSAKVQETEELPGPGEPEAEEEGQREQCENGG